MKRGKQTCRILKDIRRQIAEANDIEFITSECQYQGDCLGTCPKCEAEVQYLEQQIERKRMAEKAITLLGISAGLVTMGAMTSCNNSGNKGTNREVEVTSDTVPSDNHLMGETVVSTEDTIVANIEDELPPPPPIPAISGIIEVIDSTDTNNASIDSLMECDPIIDGDIAPPIPENPDSE